MDHCRLHVTPDQKLLRSSTPINGCIIGMACLESSFLFQTVDSISSHEDPDLPALMLYLQYLIQAEVSETKMFVFHTLQQSLRKYACSIFIRVA